MPPRPALYLSLILLLAASLRFFALDSKSLWVDEMYSLASSTGHYPDMSPLLFDQIMPASPRLSSLAAARPWTTIWPNMREGTHPPLYIILLRFWRSAFGEGVFALRSLSAFASLLAVLLLYDIARLHFDAATALYAAALMAFSGTQLRFAQDARPYALLLLFGLAALDALVRIEHLGPSLPRLIALSLSMLAMALTHYFAFGALVALGLYALVRFRGQTLFKTLAAMGSMALVFLLLWGPALWHQRHNTTFSFLIESSNHPKLAALRRFDALPLRFLIDHDGSLLTFGLGIAVLAAAIYFTTRHRTLLLPVVWFIVTAGFVASLDFARNTRHLEWIRYPLLASPGLYLLIPGLVRLLPKPAFHLIAATLSIATLAATPLYYADANPDWEGAGQMLQSRAAPTDLLLFAGREDWLPPAEAIAFDYYAHNPRRPILVLLHPPSAGLLAQIKTHPRIWVVVDERPDQILPGCRVADEYFPFINSALFQVSFPPDR
jgi:uncharacterized membrane protein